MALSHTPLDPSRLSAAAQRALMPGPARMMAARGLAPLPHPGELISVLYQLAIDTDVAIKRAADKSARELPDRILEGALSDPQVDPRVLDFFAGIVLRKPALLQRVILNQSAADETIATLAERAEVAEIDLIAQNEERLLRHPDIIGAMFANPRARMSTVDRAIELAVRNQIKIFGIPNWDVLAREIMGKGREARVTITDDEMDAAFEMSMQEAEQSSDQTNKPDSQDETDPKSRKQVRFSDLSIVQKIREALLGSSTRRGEAIRDSNRVVASTAIRSPKVTDMEAAKYASNHSLSDDVISYIAGRRDWTKSYGVKVALVQNPKTPIPESIRLMPHLHERDLKVIARSKSIPSAVAAQGRKLLTMRQRRGGGGKKR